MLLVAGCLTLLLGIVHSILGERLIFKKLRRNKVIPTYGGDLLSARQVRILWVSWHLVTLLGSALGVLLCYLFIAKNGNDELTVWMVNLTSVVMFCGAFWALVGTNGKHPSWLILMLIGVLLWLA